MSYYIGEVTDRADLDGIVDVIWATMDGVDPSHQIFYPCFGEGPEARRAAISESKERKWNEHRSDPCSHWIYIREGNPSVGRIVGGCQWRLYTQNPFPDGTPTIVATWWPEGVGRNFANEVIRQCFTPRTMWMARPHTGVSDMCILPKLQRHGLGKLLVDWGLKKTDELGVESFIEATGPGKFLYEKCGYKTIKTVEVDMTAVTTNKNDEWRRLEQAKLPIGYTAMWRPIRGIWEDSEPERT